MPYGMSRLDVSDTPPPLKKTTTTVSCFVEFDVHTTVTMETAVFWNVTQCNLVEVYQRFGRSAVSIFTFLRNVGELLTDHTASHPRRLVILKLWFYFLVD
jgi:hypothetical protein